jgi:ubiquinone/menaquinone biosynthesis C-methylase UbiE
MRTTLETRIPRALIPAFLLTSLAFAHPFAQSPAEDAADAAWLARALDIHEGSTVGEIGAGGGELTIALAKVVGPSGRILSNDLNTDRVKAIGAAAKNAGLDNVVPVDGRAMETNFPDGCCDAIFMRAVYHHFDDPAAMNASLLRSLKPGGRLAVQDFAPPPGAENPPGHRGEDKHHGVTAATVERELKAAGLEIVSSATESERVRVVARRPR